MSPSRKIDPFLAAQFVTGYRGDPGRPFRKAMAAHFDVTLRTVERELPRLVEAGLLEEHTVPTGKAGQPPKMYRVPTDVDLSPGFRRGPAYFGREQPKLRGLAGLIRENPESEDALRTLWDHGCLAVCSLCTYSVSSHVPGPPYPAVCPLHSVMREVGEDGKERWVPRPLVWNEDAWEGPETPARESEPRRDGPPPLPASAWDEFWESVVRDL
jgi:hypothetical protein